MGGVRRGPAPRPQPRPGHRVNDRRADVLFVFSGKGGVGKTSVALGLAERAGQHLRVVLVDANRGQGDIRTYLRLGRSTPADRLGGRRDRRPGPGDRAARQADRGPAPAAAGTALRAW